MESKIERIELHQERSFSEKLNASFAFMKQNIKGLFKPMLFVALPISLIAGYFMSEYFSLLFGSLSGEEPLDFFGPSSGIVKILSMYIFLFLCIIVGYIVLTCIVFAYISLYDEKKEETVSVFTRIKERIGRFIGYNIIYGILFCLLFALATAILILPPVYMIAETSSVGLGVFLLIILCLVYFVFIFLFAGFSFILQCVVFYEKLSLGETISRAFRLIKGYWWSTTGYLYIVSIIVNIGYGIFYIPLYILMIASGFGIGMGEASINEVALIITSMFTMFGAFIISPLIYLFFSFQYYNLTEKLDATGLLNQLGQLGQASDEGDDQSYL